LLLFSILALLGIGTVLISSASVVLSKQVAGNANFYFQHHVQSLLGGAVLMFLGYKLDYSFWRKMAPLMMAVSLILLVLVFIPGIGFHHGGANRWIVVGPLNFAPTEIFKLSIILYLAAWFEKRGSEIKSFLKSTLPFMVILIVAVGLIMAQPDLGTMSVVAITSGAMFFVAGASMSHIIAMIGLGITGFLGLIFTSSYRMSRLMIFLDPSSDPANKGYQINQALLAIGTGGFWGLGFGQSRQKFNYLPEASTDSIFAVTAEELGFVRASLLVIAFLVFGYQGYRVSEKAPDMFSRLTAVGITTWIVSQAMINVAAMLSIIPLTGVPLPFISYGSSSTWMLMLASGILLNISKHTQGETRESRSLRRRHWWAYFAGAGSN
jgi:cell division protein FtsW